MSTTHTAPFISQKERKRREFKAEMEKSKVTLRKVIQKRWHAHTLSQEKKYDYEKSHFTTK